MSDLYPTPTRLTLLQDVAAGLIVADGGTVWCDERLASFYDPHTATRTKVTARVRELEAAGWVYEGPDHTYRLTDLGRQIAAAAGAA